MSLETRHVGGFTARTLPDGTGMQIEGRAVPFGDVIDLGWSGSEVFDPDCVFDNLDNVKLTIDHDHVIGRAQAFEVRDDGLHMTARISDTSEGRDIAQMIRDGALDSLSVGFISERDEYDQGGVTHRKQVRLVEVAVTGMPAYANAQITGQRNHTTTTPKEPTMDLTARIDQLETETRSAVAALNDRIDANRRPAMLGAQWRSAGDYLKALAAGDQQAHDFMTQARDLISSADVKNTNVWVADQIRLVQSRRSVSTLFRHEALPDTGMTVEFLRLGNNSMSVTKKTAESAALKFGKLTLASSTASVDTYGGYTSLSRQVIERSTSPALTTALRALTIAYSVAVETAARTYIDTAITSSTANKVTSDNTPALMTADQWIDTIVDAAEATDARGADLGTLVVAKDVFKALCKVTRSGDALMDVSGDGESKLGSIDLTGVTGRMLRVPVMMAPGITDGTAAFIDPEALTMWESGGPFQLQQQNVTTLTNDYSVYGYVAIGTTFPGGIAPIQKTA